MLATNGLLYRHLVGKLTRAPIPILSLPEGAGRILLDVGCSWGRWSIAGAQQGYLAVGIDPSLGAVLAAKRLAGRFGLQAAFVVGDATALPFAKSASTSPSPTAFSSISDRKRWTVLFGRCAVC